MSEVETVICTFRVQPAALDAFTDLIQRHWTTLRSLELVTATPEQRFLGADQNAEGPVVVSIFEWASAEAAGLAHSHPEVAEIWEAMEPLCETRHGRPSMEFPHFRPMS